MLTVDALINTKPSMKQKRLDVSKSSSKRKLCVDEETCHVKETGRSKSRKNDLYRSVQRLVGKRHPGKHVKPKDSAPKSCRLFVEYLRKSKAHQLRRIVKSLMKPGLGILAADDSVRQLGNLLKSLDMADTETNRRRYHEMLLGGEVGDLNMDQFFSGVMVREESLTQLFYRGKSFTSMISERKLQLGVRFDKGVERLEGTEREYVTPGLDSLADTFFRIRDSGVKFGLWRCVYRISDHTPSRLAVIENSRTLARFAVICQQAGIVPIMAPEVLADGDYGYEEAQGAMKEILTTLVKTLADHHVFLTGALIRVTAARPGFCYKGCYDSAKVAFNTAKTLNQCLPPAIGGVLLTRGETLDESVDVLNDVQRCSIRKPFFVTFCYSLVIQEGVASLWAGLDKNLEKARMELLKRAKQCCLATMGQNHRRERGDFLITIKSMY